MMTIKSKKGITLIELLTVIAILAVMITVFYTVFITNWAAFEDRIARTNLWSEANEIVETMTSDGRFAQTIDIVGDGNGGTTAVLNDSADQPIATYNISADGQLQMNKDGVTKIMSEHLNAGLSGFTKEGRALRVQLAFEEQVFQRTISFQTSTEIYPRN